MEWLVLVTLKPFKKQKQVTLITQLSLWMKEKNISAKVIASINLSLKKRLLERKQKFHSSCYMLRIR
ncbi:hypothetical protein D3C75_1294110 [compost metagenome]